MNSELIEEVKTKNNDVADSNGNAAASLKSQSMLGENQDNEDSLRKDSVEKPEKHEDDSEDIGDEVNEKDDNYRPFLMKFAGFKRGGEDENECEKHIRTYVKNSSLRYYSVSSNFDVVDIDKGVSNAPKLIKDQAAILGNKSNNLKPKDWKWTGDIQVVNKRL